MLILQIIIYTIGSLAIILTVLPFLKHGAWWIRIGDFPRIQIAFLCLAMAAFLLIFFFPLRVVGIIFLILLLACVVYQIFRILPYTPIYPKQVEKANTSNADTTIKLLIYNVLIDNPRNLVNRTLA